MEIKISVMITCYNCEDSIDKAISSVIAMKKPFDWEILIGDDGSTDNSVNKIRNWIKQYPQNIQLFIMPREPGEEKNGTRAARNRANLLQHAKGEYLIFLDGDDEYIGEDKFVSQVAILDDPDNCNCSCTAHNIIAKDILNGKQTLMADIAINSGVIDNNKYWRNMYFHTNTILFRNKCKEMMLKQEYKDFLNDNFITYIILQYGSIYYINQAWACYNLTGNGLWTGKKRTYGCFRNMILYDLELMINPSMEKASFHRHLYDFRYINRHYSPDDQSSIFPLIKDLDKNTFHYTFLMYRKDCELNATEKKEKKRLINTVNKQVFINRIINHLPHKT